MEITPLSIALVFFLGAAAGGAVLARGHLSQAKVPSVLLVVHPLLAASGLILLGAAFVRAEGSPLLTYALIVLGTAAGLGMTLAYLRIKERRLPHALILTHALVALTGIGIIIYELAAGAPSVPPPLPY